MATPFKEGIQLDGYSAQELDDTTVRGVLHKGFVSKNLATVLPIFLNMLILPDGMLCIDQLPAPTLIKRYAQATRTWDTVSLEEAWDPVLNDVMDDMDVHMRYIYTTFGWQGTITESTATWASLQQTLDAVDTRLSEAETALQNIPATAEFIKSVNGQTPNPTTGGVELAPEDIVLATTPEQRTLQDATLQWDSAISALSTSGGEQATTLADLADQFNALKETVTDHINSDDGRWSTVTQTIVDLRAELKQFVIDTYAGTTPKYDYVHTQVAILAGGLMNLGNQGAFTAPVNGAIQAQVGGLLGVALTVQVNDITVWTSPVSLLVPTSSDEIPVNAGDVITATGVLGVGQNITVTFLPNAGTIATTE